MKQIWMLTLVLLLLLTACGGGEPATEEPAETTSEESTAAESDGSYLERALAGEFSGTGVSIFGVWVDEDQRSFAAALADFEELSGIDVEFEGSSDFETLIQVRAVPQAGETIDLRTLREHQHELSRPQCRTYTRSELGHVERLGDEVDSAEVEATDLLLAAAGAGEEHDGDVVRVRAFLQLRKDVEPGESGHVDIEQNEVRRILDRLGQAFFAVERAGDRHLLVTETDLEQSMDVHGVIHDENTIRRLGRLGGHGSGQSVSRSQV